MSLWASASASRTEKPSSRSIAATALLPLAMPPVNPSRNIFFNHRADAVDCDVETAGEARRRRDRKSTRLNSSHGYISYAVFCLKKKDPDILLVGRGSLGPASNFVTGKPEEMREGLLRWFIRVPISSAFSPATHLKYPPSTRMHT